MKKDNHDPGIQELSRPSASLPATPAPAAPDGSHGSCDMSDVVARLFLVSKLWQRRPALEHHRIRGDPPGTVSFRRVVF